jgi:putative membrane protein
MAALKNTLVLSVAFLHFYFFYLECFLWTKPKGLAAFRMSPKQAQNSAVLAANQGVYNALLGAGLLIGLLLKEPYQLTLVSYILGFICIAGIYGSRTVSRKILFLQSLPAAVALCVAWAS